MFYTYILESASHPKQRYIGYTSDLKARLLAHNEGKCLHTAKYRPWRIKMFIALEKEELAMNFESYLKSGSGHAFAKRHFGI